MGERCIEFGNVQVIEDADSGLLFVSMSNNTPEQAIAVTLGAGECKFVVKDNMNESEGMGDVWFECSACGAKFDYLSDAWLMGAKHCPSCGKKVV